jgi:indole-3-glycerol phosphate synthase
LLRADRIAIIAEIKFKSPSAGVLRAEHDIERVAWSYSEHGADALSILTEPHEFAGDLSYIARAKAATPLPVLRKDFLFDPFHIDEALVAGADAILLIAAMLERSQLEELIGRASEHRLAILLELHDEDDLAKCAGLENVIWGVNHRNLSTLEIDLAVSSQLFPQLPTAALRVAESGIDSPQQLKEMRARGAHAALVGTSLMRAPDPGVSLANLLAVDVD